MSPRTQPYIAVIGGNTCTPEDADLAERTGSEIARAGGVLVCGGLGGVMEAACRGARRSGGTTIGILPGREADAANHYIDHAICTGIGEARNVAVVMTADGVIALPGKFGTLSEISFALNYNKPVVSLNSWVVSDLIMTAETPAAAVKLIMQRLEK